LESSDRLVAKKNQEISELNSRLAAANQKISDLDEELSERFNELKRQDTEIENLKSETERLESELARRSGENSENPITENPKIEAADLLNQLKARRKKSRAELADVELILEMIEES
jgi:peptidoglycan hydrolase CwlO-like protein